METLEQYGFSNLTETFLTIDANKDKIISKKEGEDAAITMMGDFDRTAQQVCQDHRCMDWCRFACGAWREKYLKNKSFVDNFDCKLNQMTTTGKNKNMVRCKNCRDCRIVCLPEYFYFPMGMGRSFYDSFAYEFKCLDDPSTKKFGYYGGK